MIVTPGVLKSSLNSAQPFGYSRHINIYILYSEEHYYKEYNQRKIRKLDFAVSKTSQILLAPFKPKIFIV